MQNLDSNNCYSITILYVKKKVKGSRKSLATFIYFIVAEIMPIWSIIHLKWPLVKL